MDPKAESDGGVTEAVHAEPALDKWGNKVKNPGLQRVVLVGVNISLGDSILLMLKLAIGAIPALFVAAGLYRLLVTMGCSGP